MMFSCSATHLPSRQCCKEEPHELQKSTPAVADPPEPSRSSTYVAIATGGSFGRWSVGDTVTTGGVEAEQLGADPLVLEAGRSATVPSALRVQRQ